MLKYCRTDHDVRHALDRFARGKIEKPTLLFVCAECQLIQPTTVPSIVMDGKIYCGSHAKRRAMTMGSEPYLTEDEFELRLRPYDGIVQLRRYEDPVAP